MPQPLQCVGSTVKTSGAAPVGVGGANHDGDGCDLPKMQVVASESLSSEMGSWVARRGSGFAPYGTTRSALSFFMCASLWRFSSVSAAPPRLPHLRDQYAQTAPLWLAPNVSRWRLPPDSPSCAAPCSAPESRPADFLSSQIRLDKQLQVATSEQEHLVSYQVISDLIKLLLLSRNISFLIKS